MHTLRTFRLSSAVAAAAALGAVSLGAVGATAAQAAPNKPGPITGLTATATAHQDTSYDVSASWNAVANASSYRVSITEGGVTLSSATVKTSSWTPTFKASPGTASLSVKAVARHKASKPTTISVPLDDVTAPDGSFSTTWDNDTGGATLTQDALTDNAPVSGVTRTVDWNDGTAPVAWTSGTTIGHTYPLTAKRYVPTVTLEDAAHNVRVVEAPAIVIDDTDAPTGTFTDENATAWAGFTKVTVSQSALADNWSPADKITRSVDWGDGTTTAWTSGTTVQHVYSVAGSFTPAVTVTDEAHNAATLQTSSVVVSADVVAPTVKLTLPSAQHSVRAWRTLRGTAVDHQTGVKRVSLKAVEKRHGAWFGYRVASHTWVKAATKSKAFATATSFALTTDSSHRWAAKLVGLARGTLVYKVWAVDQVGNRSATVTHSASLTQR
jgi:hypothetical protein